MPEYWMNSIWEEDTFLDRYTWVLSQGSFFLELLSDSSVWSPKTTDFINNNNQKIEQVHDFGI